LIQVPRRGRVRPVRGLTALFEMGRGVAIRRTVPPYQHHEGLFLYSLFLFADSFIFFHKKTPTLLLRSFVLR
jgi:hypothetical protein